MQDLRTGGHGKHLSGGDQPDQPGDQGKQRQLWQHPQPGGGLDET